eukprot:CAMPEP_0195541194 /NCGR_PEP_ID=MMETSP0794_2-20130614/50959_1 /TAXON_ID=515487 /ORGANISM="Stephanopyxis turris, Strain CCMP 815" /LENGTH=84 /DNA_ID=CAMNT_0040675279 /DNA_START=768 /DNA_END=1023 /DNA_ORIENTATION=-
MRRVFSFVGTTVTTLAQPLFDNVCYSCHWKKLGTEDSKKKNEVPEILPHEETRELVYLGLDDQIQQIRTTTNNGPKEKNSKDTM